MLERVVVGVAKADRGREVAQRAVELAAPFGATVHFVTAVSDDGHATPAEAIRHAEGFLDAIGTGTSLTTVSHALPGDPSDVLLQVAGEVDADLIVVGNKGMKGAGRVLGSVPNAVAHRAMCSVLILDGG
jgi:nucleotide-binding universal stress UspA family protein